MAPISLLRPSFIKLKRETSNAEYYVLNEHERHVMLSLLTLRNRLPGRNIEIFPGYAGSKLEEPKLIQR